MGILNVTPDSFSDGGRFKQIDLALGHARDMSGRWGHLIDIGGESTRPGARRERAGGAGQGHPRGGAHGRRAGCDDLPDTSKAIVMREVVLRVVTSSMMSRLQEPGALGAAAGLAYRYASCTCRGSPVPCRWSRTMTIWGEVRALL